MMANRFEKIRNELGAPLQVRVQDTDRDWFLKQRVKSAEEFEACLAQIPEKPGFDRFQLLPPLEKLKTVAEGGSIVIVNMTTIRSDALLITTLGIEHLELPNLKESSVVTWRPSDSTRDTSRDVEGADDSEDEGSLEDILIKLWDYCVEPILNRLQYSRSQRAQNFHACGG